MLVALSPRRLFVALLIGFVAAFAFLLFVAAQTAGAQEALNGEAVTSTTTVITLSPVLVSFLTGTLTPLVAGLATREYASSTVKAVVGIVTAIVGAVVAWLIDHQGGFMWSEFAMYALFVFVAHVATYYGAWKPLGSANGAFTVKVPIGFGGTKPNA